MVRDAARSGAGVARLPVLLVSRDRRRLLSGRVTAFLAHLKDAFPAGTPDELGAYVG